MAIFSAIAALGSAYASHRNQSKANEENKRQYGLTLGAQMRSSEANRALRAQALQQGTRGLADIKSGYQKALGGVSAQGVEANRQIADNLRATGGQTRAAVYGRGMGSSSAQMGLQQSAAFNTARAQGGVAERLAGLRSRLFEGQGQAVAGGRARIAQILQQNAAGGAQDARGLVDVLGSLQSSGAQIDLSGLGTSLDKAFKSDDKPAGNAPAGSYGTMSSGGMQALQGLGGAAASQEAIKQLAPNTAPPQKAFSSGKPGPQSAPTAAKIDLGKLSGKDREAALMKMMQDMQANTQPGSKEQQTALMALLKGLKLY